MKMVKKLITQSEDFNPRNIVNVGGVTYFPPSLYEERNI